MSPVAVLPAAGPGRPGSRGRPDAAWQGVALAGMLGILALFLVLPVGSLLLGAVQDGQGRFIGFGRFAEYLRTPALVESALRSLRVATLAAAISTAIAFVYAYALQLSAMPGKWFFRAVALLPLLAPSLLTGIALVYLFGHQGLLKGWLGGASIYGEAGIVAGSVLWTLPHALLVLTVSLSALDGRLVEAAQVLGASRWGVFRTVTLPAARYGLLMAFVVVFVLVVTDFGVAKVVGGSANVLATDLYKQVVGQQNFGMGAVVAVWLLMPAVVAFAIERRLRRAQAAALALRAVPFVPSPHRPTDTALLMVCALVAAALVAVIGVAVFASFASFWPYDLRPSLRHYDFANADGGGWGAYANSLALALGTATVGTVVAFASAWLVEKPRRHGPARDVLNLAATLPLAVPGLALGVGYIFFFNAPGQPLRALYATLAILVACTVVHFLSVAHLSLVAALRQLDREYDLASEAMGVPAWRTAWRVHLPVCLPALLDVAGYFFVNAMTTVSAVVFLYAPHTQLASVAVLNMDDAGDTAPAAAMAVLIFVTAGAARGLFALAARRVLQRSQRWRAR